jgi:signal transduction histidine kinase
MTISLPFLSIGLLVLAAFMVFACWAIVAGMSARKKAKVHFRQSRRLSRLLDEAPALPLLVRADGRLEGSDRIGKWFGFDSLPGYFSEMSTQDCGIVAEDFASLENAVKSVQRTGSLFTMDVRIVESERRLLVKGRLSDPETMPGNAALLWIFDATESQKVIQQLGDEAKQAREAFAALSGLIEAAPMPMWYRGADLKLSLVNSAYVKAVNGQSAEHIVKQNIELIEPSEGRPAVAFAADAAESGNLRERKAFTTVAGERRAFQVVDVPIGQQGIAGYAIDIQDLQTERSAFKRFRSVQRNMLDTLSAGVVQFSSDLNMTFCNQPFQRMFAIRQQWISEGSDFDRLLERMREAGRLPETRDFPEWKKEHRAWFNSAQTVEENWLLPDGTHLRVIAQPDPDGGLLLFFEDRSEQVQLASARDTLLRVRTAMLDNLAEALAVFAPDGKLHLWNRRFGSIWDVEEDVLASHPRVDELLKTLAPQLKRPAKISEMRTAILTASSERKSDTGRLILKNDQIFSFATIPLPDGNALFTMLDITASESVQHALRDRNEALKSADRVKTEFLSNMSYEFRTPLTSISGFAEMLSSGLGGELTPEAKEYVAAILDSVDRLSTQINTVLDLSQSEAGTLPLSVQKIDMAALLGDIVRQRKSAITKYGHDVALQCGDDTQISVDPKRIEQALLHILDNSIEHIGNQGRILLAAERQTKYMRIVISDNGDGISPALVSAINDGVASGDAGNKALGLTLAREITLAHNGKFTLASELGEGTMVMIELPL